MQKADNMVTDNKKQYLTFYIQYDYIGIFLQVRLCSDCPYNAVYAPCPMVRKQIKADKHPTHDCGG